MPDLNFLEKEHIKTISRGLLDDGGLEGESAVYKDVGNVIMIDNQAIHQMATRWNISRKLLLLHMLCHEQTHATGLVQHHGVTEIYSDKAEDSLSRYGVSQQRGIDVQTFKLVEEDIIENRIFKLLEEGIVEKSAQEKFAEYLRRNPDFEDRREIDRFNTIQKSYQNFGVYPATVDMVEILIGIFSKAGDIPKNAVWNAMKRAHYEGVDLFELQIQEILEQKISRQTLEQISKAQSEQDMADIARDIYIGMSPTQREKCAKWSNLYIQHP